MMTTTATACAELKLLDELVCYRHPDAATVKEVLDVFAVRVPDGTEYFARVMQLPAEEGAELPDPRAPFSVEVFPGRPITAWRLETGGYSTIADFDSGKRTLTLSRQIDDSGQRVLVLHLNPEDALAGTLPPRDIRPDIGY